MELKSDGTAVLRTSTNAGEEIKENAAWEIVDGTRWVLRTKIPPRPETPGLGNGAVDVTEFQVIAIEKNRIELKVFDYEMSWVFERTS